MWRYRPATLASARTQDSWCGISDANTRSPKEPCRWPFQQVAGRPSRWSWSYRLDYTRFPGSLFGTSNSPRCREVRRFRLAEWRRNRRLAQARFVDGASSRWNEGDLPVLACMPVWCIRNAKRSGDAACIVSWMRRICQRLMLARGVSDARVTTSLLVEPPESVRAHRRELFKLDPLGFLLQNRRWGPGTAKCDTTGSRCTCGVRVVMRRVGRGHPQHPARPSCLRAISLPIVLPPLGWRHHRYHFRIPELCRPASACRSRGCRFAGVALHVQIGQNVEGHDARWPCLLSLCSSVSDVWTTIRVSISSRTVVQHGSI